MSKVKGVRRYDSSLRTAQAGQTRLRILDAVSDRLGAEAYEDD